MRGNGDGYNKQQRKMEDATDIDRRPMMTTKTAKTEEEREKKGRFAEEIEQEEIAEKKEEE